MSKCGGIGGTKEEERGNMKDVLPSPSFSCQEGMINEVVSPEKETQGPVARYVLSLLLCERGHSCRD